MAAGSPNFGGGVDGGKAQRYTPRDGWLDADGVQDEVKWTGNWDPISDDDIDIVIANIDNPKSRKQFDYWSPTWQLRVWFGACLDAIEGRRAYRRPDTARVGFE